MVMAHGAQRAIPTARQAPSARNASGIPISQNRRAADITMRERRD
jgi:hypothetical protein